MNKKIYRGMIKPYTVDRLMEEGWDLESAKCMVGNPDLTYTVILVTEEQPGGSVTYDLAHHVRHSPTGFGWGYPGSGPAETARCILLDFFGVEPAVDRWHRDPFPEGIHYMDFKDEVIARFNQHRDFELTSKQIAVWAHRRAAVTA